MSGEEQSAQERSEEPTEKKLSDAKKKGQIPRSKEAGVAAIAIIGFAILLSLGEHFWQALESVFYTAWQQAHLVIFEPSLMYTRLLDAMAVMMLSLLPLFVILLLAGVAGGVMLGGLNFSSEALMPKLNRLDPLAGLKRIFSMRALAELAKTILKFAFVVSMSMLCLYSFSGPLLSISNLPISEGVAKGLYYVFFSAFLVSLSLLLIAAFDAVFQAWSHKRQMRMSKQEVKDEMKETEGRPEVKQRVRQVQQEMARQRMMQAVPDADVIITNPEHFAVALRYDQSTMPAPILLAKGADFIAQKIKSTAQEHKIPVIQAPILARAVYFTTEVNAEIDADLYLVIAQLLAYVYQLDHHYRYGGNAPVLPTLDVPKAQQFDSDGEPLFSAS